MDQIMKVKLKKRRVFAAKNGSIRTPLQAALLLCFPAACVTRAQEVLMPRPEYSIAPPAMQQYQTNEMDVFAPPGTAAAVSPEATPFQVGPVSLLPHVFYRILSGDGIPAAGSNHVATTIQQISPGILFNIGSHWSLDYTPTWNLYSNKQFSDTLDQNVILTGGTTYEDWILGLAQSYISSSTPLVETGTQTTQQSWLTALKASYRFNSKMTTDLTLDQNIVSADTFTSYDEWSTLDWLNYQFWPRLDTSLGVGFGFVNVDAGSDMTYEQLQARVRWRATDKISFQVHGGLEDRQFLQGSAGSLLNPVAGGLIQYQPFEFTKFSITVDRTVAVSYFQNQVTEGTEVMGGLNQRLLKRLYLDLSGGYNTLKYVASDSSSSGAGRRDDYYTFDVRLSCPFLKRGTAAVFYQYSDDSSTAPGFTFSSSQVGFEVGYRF
jgi:hypothetical protein